MKVAIPTEHGRVCPHFGHCQAFAIFEVDPETREILSVKMLNPPPHERGVIPAWLNGQGCTHIIAGGMGYRAKDLFEQNGVIVHSGAPELLAEEVMRMFLCGELKTGANPCDDSSFRLQGHGRGKCHPDHQTD
jgi:predicted Fe-Mo cluster-binding NifX family protein